MEVLPSSARAAPGSPRGTQLPGRHPPGVLPTHGTESGCGYAAGSDWHQQQRLTPEPQARDMPASHKLEGGSWWILSAEAQGQ